MNTSQRGYPHQARVIGLAVALALIAAASYLLIGFKILGVGDLQTPRRRPRSSTWRPGATWSAGC